MAHTTPPQRGADAAQGPDPLPLHRGDRRGRSSASRSVSPPRTSPCQLKPIGTAFVALIKMMIQPVIFCTIVLGVGSVRSAASVGKVGGLALGYFLTMSTFALAIGLVVGNIIAPGQGPEPHRRDRRGGRRAGRGGRLDHRVHPRHHPRLAVLGADLRRGAADAARGAARRVRAAGHGRSGQADPARHRPPPAAGVQGPGDGHVGRPRRCLRRDRGGRRRDRRRRPEEPGRDHDRLLRHLLPLRLRRARRAAQGRHRRQHLQPAASTSAASSC